MSPIRWIVVWSVVAVVGLRALLSAVRTPRPGLDRAIAGLGRTPSPSVGRPGLVAVDRLGASLRDLTVVRFAVCPDEGDLRLLGRTPERHAVLVFASAVAGASSPLVVTAAAVAFGGFGPGLGVFAVVLAPLVGALAAFAVHATTVDGADRLRRDLRHQLSAYLDVVTMLLAADTGSEGALLDAASAGDGRLFVELRRRMRHATASGRSLVDALDAVGADLGVAELRQIAATASLSAAEGAPVARSLSAACATLRSTLAAEHEADARLRTSRLTAPLVGMALIFMTLVVYPALAAP